MCTKHTGPIADGYCGWKVVVYNPVTEKTRSFFRPKSWRAKRNNFSKRHELNKSTLTDRLDFAFHCFYKREDARRFKSYYKRTRPNRFINYGEEVRIIRVTLSGNCFLGKTSGMSGSDSSNRDAICGNIAHWDGTFER
jgi:hypothetical protein